MTHHQNAKLNQPTRIADMKRLLKLARPVIAPLAGSLLFRLVGLAAGAALLVIAVRAVTLVADGQPVGVWRLVGLLSVVAVIKGAGRYLEQFLGHTVAFKALAILRVHFFRRLEPQAPAATDGQRSGDFVARVTRDVDRVEVFFAHTLVPAVAAAITVIVTVVGVAVGVHPWLAVVVGVAFVLCGVVVPLWRVRHTGRLAVQSRLARGELVQHVTDSIQGSREVLAFDAAERRLAELSALGDTSGDAIREAGATVGVRRGAGQFLVPATLLVMTWVGAIFVADDALTWETLAIGLAAVLGAFPGVLAVEEFVADLDQAFASARRVFEVTDAAPATADPVAPVELPVAGVAEGLNGTVGSRSTSSGKDLPRPGSGRAIQFAGVRFSYPNADPALVRRALDGIDLVVPRGSTTALVGVSGAGKSSLIAMLLRYWDPDEGVVLVDGVDVSNLRLDDLRSQIAVVPQRPYIFHDSLRANLLIARPDATQTELDAACAQAYLTEVVRELPEGYDTSLGEHGSRLSGGQLQRVAIARAFLQDAPVLVLDESTSQLDAETQSIVQESLAELAKGRTVLQIAHRIETVRHADQIVVLDDGRILEQGTHTDLVAADGAYVQLLGRVST